MASSKKIGTVDCGKTLHIYYLLLTYQHREKTEHADHE